jgi:hypothetical protein
LSKEATASEEAFPRVSIVFASRRISPYRLQSTQSPGKKPSRTYANIRASSATKGPGVTGSSFIAENRRRRREEEVVPGAIGVVTLYTTGSRPRTVSQHPRRVDVCCERDARE